VKDERIGEVSKPKEKGGGHAKDSDEPRVYCKCCSDEHRSEGLGKILKQ
jgi:hypothetical protein